MADLAESLEQQVLDLPEKDRSRIALRLISSLDEAPAVSPALGREEIEEEWIEEAERRFHEIRQRDVTPLDGDDVRADLLARFV